MTTTPPAQSRRIPQWLVLVLRGAAAVLFGLFLVLAPVSALVTLVQLAAVYFLVEGSIRIAHVLPDADAPRRMPRLILGGIEVVTALVILGSVILQITLGAALITLLGIIIGLQAIAGGALTIIATMREEKGQRQVKLGAGIAGVVFGIVLIVVTAMDDLAIVPFIGVLALIYGGITIFIGWRQREATTSTAV